MARKYTIHAGETGGSAGALSGIDYTQVLNAEQYAAISAPPGPVLVIAGAGSGKTRTLTYRVAWLLDHGVEPVHILLLTFTNKAAKEMTERVRSLLPMDTATLWSGTFHSIANRILRRHADYLGYTASFSIMDAADSKTMIKGIVKELKIETGPQRFPKAELLHSVFSLAVNEGRSVRMTLQDAYPHLYRYADAIGQVYERYQERKKAANSMDFDDLLLNAVLLLQEQDHLRRLYSLRFQHILVDEYQDTNYLQSRLIDMLVNENTCLMVVGDDAQSIYSWRGADMNNILEFGVRYPNVRTFKIETNYRSVPQILELSNAAIAANERQIKKELRSVRPMAQIPPVLVPLNDERMQAYFVVQRALELIGEGVPANEIAVLYRAHAHSMELQMELTRQGVPFRITSGIRFFEQAHVKDVLAFLRFAVNPQDALAFERMVMLLPGIGPGVAQKLWRAFGKAVEGVQADTVPSGELMRDFAVPAKAKAAWVQLCVTLEDMVTEADKTPTDMILTVLDTMYDAYMQTAFDNYDQRRQDLTYLATFANRFDSAEEFLAQLSLLGNTDDEANAELGEHEPAITLSTIHQAKGLEWGAVFLIGLCDGMFPHQRVLDADDEDGLEEERRLFYVALTRAKDQLYLCYPRWCGRLSGGHFVQMPSRFLDEVPTDLLEEWQVE